MSIDINIKANVDNLTLIEIYELVAKYSIEKKSEIEFNGFKFKIEVEINLSINYTITETQ